MAMMMRLEDHLRKKKLVDKSFNQIVAEVKALARDPAGPEEKIQGSATIECFDLEQERTHGSPRRRPRKAVSKVSALPSKPFTPPDAPPIELRNMIESMQGHHLQFLMYKILHDTDLNPHHDRLSMPKNQLFDKKFLGKELKEKLKGGGLLEVKVIDPCLIEYELRMKRWVFKTSYSYLLNSGWSKIFTDKTNNLTAKDMLQVWTFRVSDTNLVDQERICFALVKHKDVKDPQEAIGSSSSMSKKEEGKEDVNGGTDSMEGVGSSMSKKEDVNGSTAHDEANESSMTEKQSVFGDRKHITIKFRNITFAKN
ncbi:PREDICTED: B3 [Prunus dulcis]|uniref:PREDICTED: B3 n=1 Tax=Prunus dulcis TaxID=3755 RepID=A0A5E4EB80_PRUDU|nr:hypothetical protein L3X38_035834 [Prunus dulcis]VVA13033.1 PREDICTED: B3 [Prunus dulcis]